MLLFQEVPAAGAAPAAAAGQAGTTAPSAPASQAPAPNMMFTVLPMLAVIGVMMFMSQRRQKKEESARESLKKGDRVVSQSGLIGELVEIENKVAKVKLAPGITVSMVASSLAPAAASGGDSQLADLKEAKAGADRK
jgi:preprotein translocase subunit YajC